MTQSMSERIARFVSAREKLSAVLEQGDTEGEPDIVAADHELSTVFSQIMDAELVSPEDCALRVEFLLKEIIVASDSDGLIDMLAEQAILDMKQAVSKADVIHKPISAAS